MGDKKAARNTPFLWALAGGAAILAVSLYGYTLLRSRPGLPVDPARVLAVDGVRIQPGSAIDATFLLRTKAPGDPLRLTILGEEGGEADLETDVAPYYGDGSIPLLFLIIGGIIAAVGWTTLLLRPRDAKARMFFWTCMAFTLTIVVSGPEYCLRAGWATIVPCLLFILLYALVPAAFLHLCLHIVGRARVRLGRIYALPALLAAYVLSVFLYGILKPSLPALRLYERTYFAQRLLVILFLLAGAAALLRGYRRPARPEVKAQIQWIILGFVVGLAPFIFLYELPRVVMAALGNPRGRPILSEDVSSLFFIFVPLSFAVAIVRHRMLDVELVINRGLVYSILSAMTAGIYVLVVLTAQKLFAGGAGGSNPLVIAAAVLLAAAAFHPAQRRIQDFVDKAFFRRRYDQRQAVLAFAEAARGLAAREDLLACFLDAIRTVIPLEKAGAFVFDRRPDAPAGETAAILHGGDPFDAAFLTGEACKPGPVLGRPRSADGASGASFGFADELDRAGLDLAVPLAARDGALCGWLGLGRKRSGAKFTAQDLGLLLKLSGELVPNLERIRLQEEVIYERASRQALDELNALKTEFIASVSHELRTPMTSIQGLAEMLRAGKPDDPARRERFLDLLVTESGRLSRLIHNVLDYGRMEMKAKRYELRLVAAQAAAAEVVDTLGPAMAEDGVVLKLEAPDEPLFVLADPDALKQAVLNLVDNAVKYAPSDKTVEVAVRDMGSEVEIAVRDHGIGIPAEARERIFERFFRTAEAARLRPRGAGLGLKIVKHIIDAHGGRIVVESEVGKGSVFRLLFPKP
jgi:signal transduction histidine kinase